MEIYLQEHEEKYFFKFRGSYPLNVWKAVKSRIGIIHVSAHNAPTLGKVAWHTQFFLEKE